MTDDDIDFGQFRKSAATDARLASFRAGTLSAGPIREVVASENEALAKPFPRRIQYFRIGFVNQRLAVAGYRFAVAGSSRLDHAAARGAVQALETKLSSSSSLPNGWVELGRNFQENSVPIAFKNRIWIVLAINEPNCTFPDSSSKIPPIHSPTDKPGDTTVYNENYSFADGKNFDLQISGKTRSAFAFINHCQKSTGNLDENEKELYAMDIYTLLTMADGSGGNAGQLTLILDPPTGNQGPPDDP
ncbi:hypothetical protein [Sandaracinobacteroides saxicola]|uniref:Uncharacterized protein n=1 Tax=Sandaracinobacteroides saxicola TaxID=2759707 RepID=A0A7G5IJ66_9SPHN|nr:hypothetical protein [Sandaracinobacteroides saxicola]QMW23408.1 hypothetical protein H3309_02585 [Sandaracinobacteroides saxicola]